MKKLKWQYLFLALMAIAIGYYVSNQNEKILLGLIGLTCFWLVVTLLVVLISTVFFGKKDMRPVPILIWFILALLTAFLMGGGEGLGIIQ